MKNIFELQADSSFSFRVSVCMPNNIVRCVNRNTYCWGSNHQFFALVLLNFNFLGYYIYKLLDPSRKIKLTDIQSLSGPNIPK